MNNIKKVLAMGCVALCAMVGMAAPHHGGHVMHHRAPIVHHHSHSVWGRGGRNFWPGFVGGVIGGAIINNAYRYPTVVTTPVVTTPIVTTPVVTTPVVQPQVVVQQPITQVQQVWVEGRYVDQVQANGSIVRTWIPGHFEQRTVVVQ